MARSKERSRERKRSRTLLFSIPVLGLLIIVGLYYAAFAPLPTVTAAQDFTLTISIQLIAQSSSGNTTTQFLVPPAVGVPGGAWSTHRYDGDGLNQRYPVYLVAPNSTGTYSGYSIIHVRSRVLRSYTLGDFFTVWGQPFGRNNTLGITSPPQPSLTKFGPDWFWSLCIGTPPSVVSIPPLSWTNETLVRGEVVNLIFSNTGCQA